MKQLLNLTHLKFFCDAVTCKSISESAQMNFVTQSTVSQAIAKLEMVLEVKLTVHSKQKFQLTPEGKILFEESRHVFKSLFNIENKLHQNSKTVTGQLSFACTNSLGMSFVVPIYKLMQENYPQVKLNMKLGNEQLNRTRLQQNEIEFIISICNEPFSNSKHLLKRGQFNLYQHVESPLHQIEQGLLIDFREGMFISELLNHFETENPLKIQAELAGWEIVARFIEKNLGIGFLPDYIVQNDRYPKLTLCPIKTPLFEYEINACFNKGIKPSIPAQAFIDLFSGGKFTI